jgi:outer membrane protein OmpA-like peptidoglycan-associated protein
MNRKAQKLIASIIGVTSILSLGVHVSRARHSTPRLKSIREIRATHVPMKASDIVVTSASAPALPRWNGPGNASMIEGGFQVTLDDSSWFEPGTARITSKGLLAALEVASTIKNLSGSLENHSVQVEGHSDSAPVVRHREEYPTNWELSGSRAFALVRVLEAHGFPRERLSGVGYADSRPEGSEPRRRIVLTVRAPTPRQEIARR